MEQVNKIYRDKVKPVVNNQIKPQLQKFEAYVNNTQNPDQFVKLLAKAEALTGIKRTRICYGAFGCVVVCISTPPLPFTRTHIHMHTNPHPYTYPHTPTHTPTHIRAAFAHVPLFAAAPRHARGTVCAVSL